MARLTSCITGFALLTTLREGHAFCTNKKSYTCAQTSRCSSSLRPLKLGLLDQIFKKDESNNWPQVTAPSDFVVPEPKPLTITESTDLAGFASAAAGLALRLGTGAFVLGWKIDTILAPELNEQGQKQYSLKLGPIRLRDSSSVLDDTMQPEKTLVLYEMSHPPIANECVK